MNKPVLWLMLLCILALVVIMGLVAGAFSDSIQRALTLPQVQAMGMNDAHGGATPTKPVQPVVPPTVTAMPSATSTPTMSDTDGMEAMGTTTILAQDTFQRTDQPLWGIASDGRTWKGDANTLAAFSITAGTGTIINGQGGLNAVLGPTGSNVEVVVQGTINHYNGASVNFGVVLRWNDANNWYKLLIDAGTLTIIKRINGVSSTLVSIPFHAQDNATYTLRFRAIGAMLFASAWQSDTTQPTNWMLVTTDTSLTSGQAGIRVLVQPTTLVHIASFLATTATGGM